MREGEKNPVAMPVIGRQPPHGASNRSTSSMQARMRETLWGCDLPRGAQWFGLPAAYGSSWL